MFKCIRGRCSENLISKLKFKKYNCRPDDYLKLETPKVSTKYGRRTFQYAGPRLWNTLPLNLRTEEDIVKFKGQLKTLLFTETERLRRTAFQYEWMTHGRAHLYRGDLGHREVALYKNTIIINIIILNDNCCGHKGSCLCCSHLNDYNRYVRYLSYSDESCHGWGWKTY